MSKLEKIADNSAKAISNEKLRISFEFIDMDTEEFFFHGMLPEFYKNFFNCIDRIKQSTEKDISQQTHPSLTPKSIFNRKSTADNFPTTTVDQVKNKLFVETRDQALARQDAVEITSKRAFELRITKASGRIHGFLWNNVFNIVWIDPAHNLYPLNKYGVRSQQNYAKVKCCSVEELIRIKQELVDLQEQYDELFNEFASTES